ncbi:MULTISPECIES: TonB-dependent receptor plug domain-containing protein [Methylotenera]|uniref:TonB-dependent receptor plug domain-containing protein n=1 Tax=Methylotenera TaxID=359407 RepID=UPI000362CBB8|nr:MULTISPECIES: TonB-dependent receptor [Methylotenera]
MKNYLNQLLFLAVIIACEPLAFAEESSADMLSEDDYMGEVPKVLTVSRLAQAAADVPSAVTVISRETIRASGIVDLPEIFRLVPGMYVGTNAGYVYNTNHAVSYHGISNAYPGTMQVMINGRSVYSPLFGGVNWSELPIALVDIERIEVTRGPNAASYGANSYFGVINIITQTPSETPRNTIVATHGSGRNEAFYRHAGKVDDFGYRITTGYRQDDGLDNRNDFKRTRFMSAQAEYRLDSNDNLEFEFGITEGARGEGNINEDNLVFLPRTKQINNHFGLIRWRHNISETSDLTLQAYHSYDRSDDTATTVNLRPLIAAVPSPQAPIIAAALVNGNVFINNEVVQKRTDIEAQHTFALADNARAVWGASIRRDSTYAPFYLATKDTDYFDLMRLFGHVELRPHEKLTINAGAMLEHNDFSGTDISPRASINFKPDANHSFRLGVSSALRTPNYVEERFQDRLVIPTTLASTQALIFQYRANKGDVEPEQIVSTELGYIGEVGRLHLDVRLFSDRINHVIRDVDRTDFTAPANTLLLNPILDADITTNSNQGGARIEGIEYQANWPLTRDTRLLFNHAYVYIRETQDGLKRNYTKSMPRNTISTLITHRFNPQWDGSFAYYQTSATTLLGDGDPVDLIRKCDVRLARKFDYGRRNGEIAFVIENLFNDHYQEFADYNTLKRRARVNVRLDF